ncbi:hypothetical protein A2U01_0094085, partial [Trifolium medium]|nr:hypothetical protein [Trifolium medium]
VVVHVLVGVVLVDLVVLVEIQIVVVVVEVQIVVVVVVVEVQKMVSFHEKKVCSAKGFGLRCCSRNVRSGTCFS